MKSVCFGLAEKYDTGRESSVAMRGEVVIEVHKSENEDKLWYRVGRVALGIVKWSDGHRYDDGINPAVAFSGMHIVEVHQSENRPRLFYRVGALDADRISWGPSVSYDDGEYPRVAVNIHGKVVEVHAAPDDEGDVHAPRKFDLWCRVGQVSSNNTIQWGKSDNYTTGRHPSVALFDDGTVVEMHESENTNSLWWRVGKVQGDAVVWEKSERYVDGHAPVVACDYSARQVVEVHEQASDPLNIRPGTPLLSSALGTVAGDSIQWGDSRSFDTGWHPGVACWGRYAVQTHGGNDRTELWSSLSLAADRKQWMLEEQEVLDPRPLLLITFPATHDSGLYEASLDRVPVNCRDLDETVPETVIHPWAIAQKRDIGGQLSNGVRYFDLRPYPTNDGFRVYHDLIGPKMSEILDQLAAFLRDVRRELVILKFKIFCSFDDNDHARLIDLIRKKVGAFLYTGEAVTGKNLLQKTFATLTSAGPCVLIDYHDDYVVTNPTPGFWRDIPIYDQYSNKETYAAMRKDQLDKLKKNANNSEALYLLSWTLTPQGLAFVKESSLHELSRDANRHLGSFCNEWASTYRMNFLYVDFFEDARATDVAIQMNFMRP